MATLQEIRARVLADDGERAAFKAAAGTSDGLRAFLEARGCEASPEEAVEFAGRLAQGELADEELEAVAGGCGSKTYTCPYCGDALIYHLWKADANGNIVSNGTYQVETYDCCYKCHKMFVLQGGALVEKM